MATIVTRRRSAGGWEAGSRNRRDQPVALVGFQIQESKTVFVPITAMSEPRQQKNGRKPRERIPSLSSEVFAGAGDAMVKRVAG